ncbi:hypothetical protein [Dactylosporangium sp. NPDC005555]|uniref:hypothetical protein n=1 Tax=Dactylosporangium sp. NPDC005555 TaxID=3154889 RepID=UPI0033B9431B
MSAAGLLRLCPPAVRERWGAEIGDAVTASGIRSWPDTLAAAGRRQALRRYRTEVFSTTSGPGR